MSWDARNGSSGGGSAGSGSARWLRFTRASVTCGQNGRFSGGAYQSVVSRCEEFSETALAKALPTREKHAKRLLGLVEALRLQRIRVGLLELGAGIVRVLEVEREETRAARRHRHDLARSERGRSAGSGAHGLGYRVDLLLRAIAEDRERYVEGLLRDGPQLRPAGHEPVTPGRELPAHVGGQVERDEEPRPRRTGPLPGQTGSSSPASRRRRMCIATVVARSRISARSPGRRTSRAITRPSASLTDQQT